MKLSLVKQNNVFGSIEAVDLPPLTIITGRNGSGKSKLLLAISSGAVSVDGEAKTASSAPLKTWNDILPNLEARAEIAEIRSAIQQFVQRQVREMQRPLIASGAGNLWRFAMLPQAQFLQQNLDSEQKERLDELRSGFENAVRQQLASLEGDYATGLEIRLPDPSEALIAVSELHERIDARPNILAPGLIEQFCRFASLELISERADLLRARGDRNFDLNNAHAEFRKQHGVPPWEVLNRMMEEVGLNYVINQPSVDRINEYTPRLTNRSSGVEVVRAAVQNSSTVAAG